MPSNMFSASIFSNMYSGCKKIWRKTNSRAFLVLRAPLRSLLSTPLRTPLAIPLTAIVLLLAPPLLPNARAIELGSSFGYGALGYDGLAPHLKASMSFGRRLVLDVNGGVIFTNTNIGKNIGFSTFGKVVPVQDEIKDVTKPSGNILYSVGLDLRVFMRKGASKHNAYLGVGVDWLPQLKTHYPGVKLSTGYQISLLKKRSLNLRFGAEYYIYGVVPVNTLAITTAISYRI